MIDIVLLVQVITPASVTESGAVRPLALQGSLQEQAGQLLRAVHRRAVLSVSQRRQGRIECV